MDYKGNAGMIEFQEVTKIYENEVHALENISLNIELGDFVFLVGPSGAGKSTFIKLLLKEIKPTSGKVIVNDVDIDTLQRKQIPYYRRKIGMVFQDYRLIPTLKVYENVAFAMRVVEANHKEIIKRVPAVLEMTGLASESGSLFQANFLEGSNKGYP